VRRKIVLAGGTGFVGTYLSRNYSDLGYEVKMISRQPGYISWDDREALIEAIDESELVVNLAGKSVNCRYNEKNKEEILRSRVETTRLLGEAISQCTSPPPLWINSSTATIYRHAEDRPMTEADGELGTGFSVGVAKAWEEAFFSFQLPKTRQVALRISIALGKHGGVIPVYRNLVRFGLGGRQGPGSQRFSWIHIEDLYRIIRFIQEQDHLNGVFNCASPYPITNQELMQQLRRAMGVRIGLPAPRWMLEIGAIMIRTETELILKSRWVLPDRLEKAGYTFQYPTIQDACTEIFGPAISS